MRIGIDIDGVILDYMNIVRAYAELYDFEELKKDGVINREGMKVKNRYDWTKEELDVFAKRYFVSLTKKTPFNPLAIDIIKRLKSEGHKLYIITNRGIVNEESIEIVMDMFKEKGLVFDDYFWKVTDKVAVCLENNIDIMIDDSTEIIETMINNGIYGLYFREKGSRILPDNKLLFDVDNWGEIYRYIKRIESAI